MPQRAARAGAVPAVTFSAANGQAGIVGEWSVKDVLAHFCEWEQMVLNWLAASQRGELPAVPAEGYKWSQLPALNEMIRQVIREYQSQERIDQFRSTWSLPFSA